MAASSTVISSRSNQRVKQLRAAFSGNRRLSEGLAAIEGEHLLEEALRSGIEIAAVFATPGRSLPAGLSSKIEIVRLSEDVFSSAVETRSPQGVAALIEPPSHVFNDLLQHASPLILMAAGVQDPGNLGTLIRSAEAFGASGVLTTAGTASEWNQKALRASAGSVFRLPVVSVEEHQVADLSRQGLRLFAATGHQEGMGTLPANDADLRGPSVIMIGNEGTGLSDTWLRLATSAITIPCPGPVESLNAAVAGSLLLYEASRQRALSSQQNARIPNTQPRHPTGATR
jgi:TrmH family RNA methyltransferase